ncbi:MAG: DUF2721 domain-containing protein [Cyclobacteriaceae bacterium]|nr:DUF2721 domain-containing protein [Cyclobacteriaceae bacterium]
MQCYLPITIIPAAALLVLSTSNFIIALVGEVRALQNTHEESSAKVIIRRKIAQLRLLSKAIISLYISIGLMTLSAMILAWHSEQSASVSEIPMIILGAGLLCLFAAIALLILYAFRAVKIRQVQFSSWG